MKNKQPKTPINWTDKTYKYTYNKEEKKKKKIGFKRQKKVL